MTAAKAENYKSKLDVKRLHDLAAALFLLRDYAPALSADLAREVRALTLRVAESSQ
jgi:hypothetical protein